MTSITNYISWKLGLNSEEFENTSDVFIKRFLFRRAQHELILKVQEAYINSILNSRLYIEISHLNQTKLEKTIDYFHIKEIEKLKFEIKNIVPGTIGYAIVECLDQFWKEYLFSLKTEMSPFHDKYDESIELKNTSLLNYNSNYTSLPINTLDPLTINSNLNYHTTNNTNTTNNIQQHKEYQHLDDNYNNCDSIP